MSALTREEGERFDLLEKCVQEGYCVLARSQVKDTGEEVALICAVLADNEGTLQIRPLARLLMGNPIETYTDPAQTTSVNIDEDGGDDDEE